MNDAERIAALEARIAELEEAAGGLKTDMLRASAIAGLSLSLLALRRVALDSASAADEIDALERRAGELSAEVAWAIHDTDDMFRDVFAVLRRIS